MKLLGVKWDLINDQQLCLINHFINYQSCEKNNQLTIITIIS